MDKDNDEQFFLDAMKALNKHSSTSEEAYNPIQFSDFIFDENTEHWIDAFDDVHYPAHLTANAIKKLKKKPTNHHLDLHQMSRQQATEALMKYIPHHHRRQHSIIRIICGKGLHTPNQRPILKNLCYQFLIQNPMVVAFCTADVRFGGLGCYQVALRYD